MKDLQKLVLIDGSFSPQDSREILMSVFKSKIQFHNNKNFSSQERFGHDDEVAVERIPQLIESIEKLIEILQEAEKEGKTLVIKSNVEIAFSE